MDAVRQRRPRFDRVPIEDYIVTQRDVDILRQLRAHRFLNTDQVKKIFSTASTVKNLKALFHNGYIDHPPAQKAFRNRPLVHALSDKGDRELELWGYGKAKRGRSELNRTLKPWSLKHPLLNSSITIALERSCGKRSGARLLKRDEVLERSPEATRKLPKPLKLTTTVLGKECSIIVDDLYALEFDEQPGELKLLFVEADCLTEPVFRSDPTLSSIAGKLMFLRAYAKAKGHVAQFGVNNFRTLFLTTGTDERVANFVLADQQIGNGTGSTRFLFGTERALATPNFLEAPLVNGRGEVATLA